MLGYKVAELESEFYYCCTKNSPIGLGPKYIKIPKSLKAKIIGAKKFSLKEQPYHIWSSNPISLSASIEPAAIELCHNKINKL